MTAEECIYFTIFATIFFAGLSVLFEVIEQAVSKRRSKKPIQQKRAFFCPDCKQNVGLIIASKESTFSHFQKYCSNCGRRINWNEIKGDLKNECSIEIQ